MTLSPLKITAIVSICELTLAPWSMKQQMCLNFNLLGKTSVLYRLIYRWNYVVLSLVKMIATENKGLLTLAPLAVQQQIQSNTVQFIRLLLCKCLSGIVYSITIIKNDSDRRHSCIAWLLG